MTLLAIEIARVAGFATIQDRGRPGWMHEGVPPGGALVPELLDRANRAAGNGARDVAGIELVGSIVIAARGGSVVLGTEDGERRLLGDGERATVEGRRGMRVRYLAVGGGVEVERVLGGRGTLVVAGFGGFEGRGLRRGDRVGVGGEGGGDDGGEDASAIRVVTGPDLDRFAPAALDLLFTETFTISPSSNRTGTRLVGHRLPVLAAAADSVSTPRVAGAIEVPPSGEPLVLGPDHPTTGGYPVLGVVARAALGRFHARAIGAAVRFSSTDAPRLRRV